MSSGAFMTSLILVYVQENLSWALGFGIPCIVMVFSLLVFLLGTKSYRYVVSENEKGPFSRIGRVFVATFRNRYAISSTTDESHRLLTRESSEQFK